MDDEEIERVLNEQVRPLLRVHNGDIELVDFSGGVLRVKYLGSCADCPSAADTTQYLVETKLTAALPQVRSVELVKTISEDLLCQARQLLFGDE